MTFRIIDPIVHEWQSKPYETTDEDSSYENDVDKILCREIRHGLLPVCKRTIAEEATLPQYIITIIVNNNQPL